MESLLFPMAVMFLVLWLVVIRPQQKERKVHAEMLGALKKGDKIITIGGVFGTVAAVHEHELVLKVDEKSNTRIRVLKSSVHQRLTGKDDAAASAESSSDDKATGAKADG